MYDSQRKEIKAMSAAIVDKHEADRVKTGIVIRAGILAVQWVNASNELKTKLTDVKTKAFGMPFAQNRFIEISNLQRALTSVRINPETGTLMPPVSTTLSQAFVDNREMVNESGYDRVCEALDFAMRNLDLTSVCDYDLRIVK